MSANQILIMQENANGEFAIKTVTPEAGKVIGFDSELNPTMVDAGSGSGGTSTVFYSQTDLNIDGANGNFFLVGLSASASFTLSNIAVGVQYYLLIKNTSASLITISMPNTADVKALSSISIPPSSSREIAMIFDSITRYWQISEGVL